MAEATRRRAAGGLVVVCAAQFVIGVDGLAVAVALPSLQRDLELTTGQVQWVLTAFGLGFGGLLLLGGRLGRPLRAPALLVFGVSAAVGFVILTGQAVADVGPDEQGVAAGVFETANHLGGGAAAVALYATVIALVAGEGAVGPEALARGYGAAFLAAAGLAVLGAAGAWQLHGQGGWPTARGG